MAKIVDISNGIYLDLEQPADISIPSISTWLRQRIGDLNNLLNTTFAVDSTSLELIDAAGIEIGEIEVSVYKQLYYVRYFERQVKNSLGVAGVDILQEATSDGGTVSFVNRNQIAQSYIQLKRDANDLLNKLINYYKHNAYKPQQVIGADLEIIRPFPIVPPFIRNINNT